MNLNFQNVSDITRSNLNGVNIAGSDNNIGFPNSTSPHPIRAVHCILIAIDIVILFIAIIVLCHVMPRGHELQFDYIGMLVGILAILVTVLVCWNIYTFIDIRQQSKRLNGLLSSLQYIQNNNSVLSEFSFFNIYEYLLLNSIHPNLEYHLLNHGVNSIAYAMQNDDVITAKTITKVLSEMLVEPSKIHLPKVYKEHLFTAISNVRRQNTIEGFAELIEKMALISLNEQH